MRNIFIVNIIINLCKKNKKLYNLQNKKRTKSAQQKKTNAFNVINVQIIS
jgi:hypothetical protein